MDLFEYYDQIIVPTSTIKNTFGFRKLHVRPAAVLHLLRDTYFATFVAHRSKIRPRIQPLALVACEVSQATAKFSGLNLQLKFKDCLTIMLLNKEKFSCCNMQHCLEVNAKQSQVFSAPVW